MRFRDVFYRLVPSWLSSGDGERVLYSLGLMQDAMAERFRLSYEADLPEYAPDDALGYMGRDRKIRRGINEPAAAYAARLIRYLDDHKTQGNPFALMDQLYAYLQTDGVTLRTIDRRGNWFERASDGTRTATLNTGAWDWDGGALTEWARFWVVIYSDKGPWSTQWTHPGGSATDGTTTATADEIAGVMAIIREWKPAGTRCEWVIVSFDPPDYAFTTALDFSYATFDGVNDYVTMGVVAALNFDYTDSFTLSAWIKTSVTSLSIMGNRQGAPTYRGCQLRVATDGTIQFWLAHDSSAANRLSVVSAATVDDGGWHHVAVVYAGIGTDATIYIDGAPVSSAATGTVSATTQTATAFKFGFVSEYFNGAIARVSVWSSTLTPANVAADYAAGPSGALAVAALGDWRFNNVTYPTVPDGGTGANNGTMTNMDPGDVTDDEPAGDWGDWSVDDRPARFTGARYWRGPR